MAEKKIVGVVLLPDNKTDAYVKTLAKSVDGNKISFGPAHTHLSLLHAVIRGRDVERVQKFLNGVDFPVRVPFHCREILYQPNGRCFLEVRQTRSLLKIQRLVLPIAAIRVRGVSFSWRANATIGQKRAYTRYGYPNVGAAWQSHFTFGVTEPHEEHRTAVELKGTISAVALVEIGNYGTATKILYRRPLQ